MRDIPGPTPGQEVTTPSSAGEAAAASADTSSHSTRHFACDLTMHSASLIPLTVPQLQYHHLAPPTMAATTLSSTT